MSVVKKIVAFGNPLLDTIVNVSDNVLFLKYDICEDTQKEIMKDEMLQLTDDISGLQQHHSAGGCSQNMLRVLQWLMRKQCDAYIFGSVGKDPHANILGKMLQNDGVHTQYIEQNFPTGRTVSLIRAPTRTLLAYIGAAEVLPLNDLLNNKKFKPLVICSDYVYIEGFFLTNRIETAKYILNFCNENNKTVIFNICGEYIFEMVPDAIVCFVQKANIVFGNKREFIALQKFLNIECFETSMRKLLNTCEDKMLIVTDAANPIKCYKVGEILNIQPQKVAKEELKDTTAAGDSFAAGFIAGLCLGKSTTECAKLGSYAAAQIIRQLGCSLPEYEADVIL